MNLVTYLSESYQCSNNVAIRDDSTQFSYSDVESKSAELKAVLDDENVYDNERIVIYQRKSAVSALSIVNLVMNQYPYIFITKSGTNSTLVNFLENTECCTLLVEESLVKEVEESISCIERLTIITVNEKGQYKIYKSHSGVNRVRSSKNIGDLICIKYTSGSTGAPKGVPITTSMIKLFIECCVKYYNVDSGSNFIAHSPFNTDMSLLDIFYCFKSGGCLCVIDETKAFNSKYLADFIIRHNINFWHSVPSAARGFTQVEDFGVSENKLLYSNVKYFLLAGEVFKLSLAEKISSLFPSAKIYNTYGCTETNDTFVYNYDNSLDLAENNSLPIGFPLEHVKFKIIDDLGNESSKGELYVHTDTCYGQYLDGTSNVVELSDGDKYYRTFDVVNMLEDGMLSFIQRSGQHIKVNGHRVSLVEIENVLCDHDLVRDACVVAIENYERIDIIAFIHRSKVSMSSLAMRKHMTDKLPIHKRPVSYLMLDQPFPMTSNGKVNKEQLKELL